MNHSITSHLCLPLRGRLDWQVKNYHFGFIIIIHTNVVTLLVRARINSGKMQIRKQMYSLLSRLYSSENAIIISIVRSGMFEDSTLFQQWLKAVYFHYYTP